MTADEANEVGGWMPDGQLHRKPSGKGPLKGLTFALKDLFDVRGHVASCGHPDWKRTHAPAERDAPVLRTLLNAGAALRGVTVMDEMAYSLTGDNPHYGTPRNPVAPGRVCGGSSCGSAAVVAAKQVDFALGTDTGGSIRVPGSFCGLYGLRPSHGRVSTRGAVPLSQSFDTVGWFARDAEVLARVGEVLLGEPASQERCPKHLLLAEDAFDLLDNAPRTHLYAAVRQASKLLLLEEEPLRISTEGLDRWHDAFRRIQSREAWREHGAWIERYRPSFGPGVCERFLAAEGLAASSAHVDEDEALRESVRCRMRTLLREGTFLVLPSAPGPAPKKDADPETLSDFRTRAMRLTCLAGLAGLPQVTVPLSEVGGLPLGLSVLAAPGQDTALLAIARSLSRSCRVHEPQTAQKAASPNA